MTFSYQDSIMSNVTGINYISSPLYLYPFTYLYTCKNLSQKVAGTLNLALRKTI